MSTNLSDKLTKYKVSIFEESYSVISDEPESHIVDAARLVDTYMHEIAKKTLDTDSKKVAVLVALQLASKTLKSNNIIEQCNNFSDKLLDNLDYQLTQLDI